MRTNSVFQILSEEILGKISEEAMETLGQVGFYLELEEGFDLLADYGCRVNKKQGKVWVPSPVVIKALSSAPAKFKLYGRDGEEAVKYENGHVNFDPGSAAINILDGDTGEQRQPMMSDLVKLAKLVSQLQYFSAQSTALVPGDVPGEISDSVRLYAALKYCSKPVITGTFRRQSFIVMKEMLKAVRGSERKLREKPLAVFDCCPSPPLRWSELTAAAVVDCARAGIPVEFVSMPLMGATAPVTFVGALVQHAAENLSGVVLAQVAAEGCTVVYGGSPAVFDMRTGTTPMGAIETMMLDMAYAQVGRSFSLPTHAYMGLSDSRRVDYQGGFESGMGAVLAAAAGINMISGAGMMDFESCQSFEKLVLDNEICGMALRMHRGIEPQSGSFGVELLRQYAESGDFLKSKETRELYRSEHHFPSEVVERRAGDNIRPADASERAHTKVTALLANEVEELDEDRAQKLKEIMLAEAGKYGFEKIDI